MVAEPSAVVPHPRERPDLAGHVAASTIFADAIRSGRLHHAWLIGGPPGIGEGDARLQGRAAAPGHARRLERR